MSFNDLFKPEEQENPLFKTVPKTFTQTVTTNILKNTSNKNSGNTYRTSYTGTNLGMGDSTYAPKETKPSAPKSYTASEKQKQDPFLEGFYSVADKPKEERRSYNPSPYAKSRAILDSMSQTKQDEEDDFLKGFYSVADRPKEETPISAQPPTVQKNTQTTYKPGDWIRSTMTQPTPWNTKNTDLSPHKVNYASQTNTSATTSQNTRTGETRDKYDSRVRNQYAARRQAEEDATRERLQAIYDDMQTNYKPSDWVRWTTAQPNKPFYQQIYANTDMGFEYPQEKDYVEDVPASDVMYGNNSGEGLDTLSNFLTVASLIPGVDTFADLAAIPVDLTRDDYLSAGLDLVGAFPLVGEIADFAKYAKIADDVSDVAKLAENSDNVYDLVKISNTGKSIKEFLDASDDAVAEMAHIADSLSQSSPIKIPANAKVIPQIKQNGPYYHIKYIWDADDGFEYTCRWHTRTGGAPLEQGDSWVVERVKHGIGFGENAHKATKQVYVKNKGWVDAEVWEAARKARKTGTSTQKQKELLNDGHWNT